METIAILRYNVRDYSHQLHRKFGQKDFGWLSNLKNFRKLDQAAKKFFVTTQLHLPFQVQKASKAFVNQPFEADIYQKQDKFLCKQVITSTLMHYKKCVVLKISFQSTNSKNTSILVLFSLQLESNRLQ